MVGLGEVENSISKFEDMLESIKFIKELKIEEVNGFFARIKRACKKDNRFITVKEHSDFLIHMDVIIRDFNIIKNEVKTSNENGIKQNEELTLLVESLKKELAYKNNIIDGLEANKRTNEELITNFGKKESEFKKEIDSLNNRLDIKSKQLDQKSIELAGEKKRHDSCLKKLDEKSTEVKRLNDEIKELNATMNNKITQGIRAKCNYDADAILKQSKEPVKPVKAICNSSGVKIQPELVIEARRLFASGVKKFEIEKILGLNKSTTIRICNNESYLAPKYFPDGIVPEGVLTPKNNTVEEPKPIRGKTNGVVVLDECAFVEKVPSKAKQLLKKNPNRKKKK